MERAGWTRRAREREGTELELIRSRRLPRSRAAVAVDSRAHATIGAKGNCVLRLVIGCQRLVVAALEFYELPGRAAEIGGWIRRRAKSLRPVDRRRASVGDQWLARLSQHSLHYPAGIDANGRLKDEKQGLDR